MRTQEFASLMPFTNPRIKEKNMRNERIWKNSNFREVWSQLTELRDTRMKLNVQIRVEAGISKSRLIKRGVSTTRDFFFTN